MLNSNKYNANSPIICSPTIDECRKYTKFVNDEINERTIYVFDYSGIQLDWRILRNLINENRWNVIKDPYILNYINETLINSAAGYVMNILVHFLFLLLLYFHVHNAAPNWQSITITVITIMTIASCIWRVSNWF